MDTFSVSRFGRFAPGIAAGVASFALLTGVFLYTMHLHYQALDWPYLSFAMVRIALLSAVVAILGYALGRLSSWRWPVFAMLGAAAGFVGGFAYVQLAAA